MKETSSIFQTPDMIAAPCSERDMAVSSAAWQGFTEIDENQMGYMPCFVVQNTSSSQSVFQAARFVMRGGLENNRENLKITF